MDGIPNKACCGLQTRRQGQCRWRRCGSCGIRTDGMLFPRECTVRVLYTFHRLDGWGRGTGPGGVGWASLGFWFLLKVGVGSRLEEEYSTYVWVGQGGGLHSFGEEDPQPPSGTLTPLIPLFLGPLRERGKRKQRRAPAPKRRCSPLVWYWGGGDASLSVGGGQGTHEEPVS